MGDTTEMLGLGTPVSVRHFLWERLLEEKYMWSQALLSGGGQLSGERYSCELLAAALTAAERRLN